MGQKRRKGTRASRERDAKATYILFKDTPRLAALEFLLLALDGSRDFSREAMFGFLTAIRRSLKQVNGECPCKSLRVFLEAEPSLRLKRRSGRYGLLLGEAQREKLAEEARSVRDFFLENPELFSGGDD